MLKKIIVAIIAGFFIISAAAWGADLTPEASLKQKYPDIKIESFQLTPIKGVYEMVTDKGLLYYAPEAEAIILGGIITKDGKNITQRRREEINQRKDAILLEMPKTLPLSKASEDKIRHILCASDRVGAYKEVFSGQLDTKPLVSCASAEETALMKSHREQAVRLGVDVDGTPLFIIDGHIVHGANIPEIEKLLGAPVK